jgi:selenide, water dikinase
MGQGVLARILSALPTPSDPRILVGHSRADDACVFRISEEEALVSTVDYFTPIVDDPYLYGAIAAANSLSDVYAMGAVPLYALAIAAFPDDPKILPLLADVLAGAADKAQEAGIAIIGGHTIKDREPKFGLAVTGTIHPREVWSNRDARAGDAIVLTKPLGTGVITSAIKWGMAPRAAEEAAVAAMTRLNAAAARAGREAGISTATDVTGYGLLGHLIEVMEGSGLCAEIRLADVPVFPDVRALMRTRTVPSLPRRWLPAGAGAWIDRRFGAPPIPGGARDNLAHQRPKALLPPGLSPEEALLLADPQTSGGLLMFVPEMRLERLRRALAEAGEGAWTIGRTFSAASPDTPRVAVALPGYNGAPAPERAPG